MADFPSLSCVPLIEGWEESLAVDPTIRNQSEAGYVVTRARFTRIPEKWSVVYRGMTNTDKNTLRTFEKDTVRVGSLYFGWTNPKNSSTYTVRFMAPIVYRPLMTSSHWEVVFQLEEV